MKTFHLFGYIISISRNPTQNEAITPEKIYASKKKKAFESKPPLEVSTLRRDITDYGEVEGWLLTDAEERAAKAQQWWDKSMQAAKEQSILPRLVQVLKEERKVIKNGKHIGTQVRTVYAPEGYKPKEGGTAEEVRGGCGE